jgi:hypothetical protein
MSKIGSDTTWRKSCARPPHASGLAIDLKGIHYTGYYGVWFGLDPTEAPLLLRDIGTCDIYALRLEQK